MDRQRIVNLLAAVAAITVFGFTFGLMFPLLSLIMESKGVPSQWIGINSAMHPIGIVLSIFVIPYAVRRFGAKRAVIGSGLITAAVIVCYPLFPIFWWWFVLRLLQGLALGGEYGGAATYVAEHAPHGRRGFYTSFIQITATAGLFLSLMVILFTQLAVGPDNFRAWGWRVPFALSGILVVVSYFIRRNMDESPLFSKLKAEGRLSENPLKEAFASKANRRLMLIAMFGAIVGQGVVWHTGQFYAQIFINKILQVDFITTNLIIAASLVVGTPLFVYFGSLSDRVGRKKVMLGGMALAALGYYPLFSWMATIVSEEIFLPVHGSMR